MSLKSLIAATAAAAIAGLPICLPLHAADAFASTTAGARAEVGAGDGTSLNADIIEWVTAALTQHPHEGGEALREISDSMRPFLECLAGEYAAFSLAIDIEASLDARPLILEADIAAAAVGGWAVNVQHATYPARIVRLDDVTTFELPQHDVRFVGRDSELSSDRPQRSVGDPDATLQAAWTADLLLAPDGLLERLVSIDTTISPFLIALTSLDPEFAGIALTSIGGFAAGQIEDEWIAAPGGRLAGTTIRFDRTDPGSPAMTITVGEANVDLRLSNIVIDAEDIAAAAGPDLDSLQTAAASSDASSAEVDLHDRDDRRSIAQWTSAVTRLGEANEAIGDDSSDSGESASVREVDVDRVELERLIARGIRRGLEVLAPSFDLKNPPRDSTSVVGGTLQWVGGHRLAVLQGTPEQIGRAHALLMPEAVEREVDSVLHLVGLAVTMQNGRWFLDDLRGAFERLEPYIPAHHLAEMDAMADALGYPREMMRLANVFPEMFHCSGFAIFGSATADGMLYHGRVLDYMTDIGLQDAAVTKFIIPTPESGRRPFVSAGYAGFVGTVSGMNDAGIALGQMGGRGEGQWDGVPMASLMRLALEECRTLDEVKHLWTTSQRTCEYFYVWSDGDRRQALGVAAWPDRIEFMEPGEGHEMIGPGLDDTVVLSIGSRLEALRQRITDSHGSIDREAAIRLMDRPVAMSSNLHNVLFVPEHRELWLAHADREKKAWQNRYVKYDLRAILAAATGGAATDAGEADSTVAAEASTAVSP
ncbi:MAG: C45 family autoproteolytic acyltransferase/hydrolase [Planctomycetota bacterium]